MQVDFAPEVCLETFEFDDFSQVLLVLGVYFGSVLNLVSIQYVKFNMMEEDHPWLPVAE